MFSQELKEALSSLPETRDMAEKLAGYNKILQDMGNKYAPPRSKEIRIEPRAPWFDSEYKTLRRSRRKAEKRFRKTRSVEDKEEFIKLRKETTSLAKSKKCSLISQKIDQGSSRALYQVVNNLTDSTKPSVLPAAKSDEQTRSCITLVRRLRKFGQNFHPERTQNHIEVQIQESNHFQPLLQLLKKS